MLGLIWSNCILNSVGATIAQVLIIVSTTIFTVSNVLIVSKLKYSFSELILSIYNSYKAFIIKKVCLKPMSNMVLLKLAYEKKYELHLIVIILTIALDVGFIKDLVSVDFLYQSLSTKFALILLFLYLSYINLCNYHKIKQHEKNRLDRKSKKVLSITRD